MKNTCTVPSFQTRFKVVVVGCGSVGATAAYAMMLKGTPTDLVLFDVNKEKAEGLLLDFEHALSFVSATKLSAGNDFALCKDAHVVVVTAGARQQEGETRLDLLNKNRKIFKEVIPQIAKAAPNAILLIVTNPVDILTYEAIRLSGFPASHVFGTGTMLDTARFRFHLSEKLCLSPKSIQAFVLGEHGDSSFPVLSSAHVAGKLLNNFDGFSDDVAQECFKSTKEAAYRIIHDLGYTCYSIAAVVCEIVEAIFQHARIVVPLSVELKKYYGHSDLALSVPCVLDSTGIAEVIDIPLNEKEQKQLANSADVLKKLLV